MATDDLVMRPFHLGQVGLSSVCGKIKASQSEALIHPENVLYLNMSRSPNPFSSQVLRYQGSFMYLCMQLL